MNILYYLVLNICKMWTTLPSFLKHWFVFQLLQYAFFNYKKNARLPQQIFSAKKKKLRPTEIKTDPLGKLVSTFLTSWPGLVLVWLSGRTPTDIKWNYVLRCCCCLPALVLLRDWTFGLRSRFDFFYVFWQRTWQAGVSPRGRLIFLGEFFPHQLSFAYFFSIFQTNLFWTFLFKNLRRFFFSICLKWKKKSEMSSKG